MALKIIRRTFSVLKTVYQSTATSSPKNRSVALNLVSFSKCVSCRGFYGTPKRNDLMEFFDEEENWGKQKVMTGRPWSQEELRLKSNSDLHKLWYVLLKERNMLLTMEHAYLAEYKAMPDIVRKFKVEESMENVMAVVKERDEAFSMLETGKPLERKRIRLKNFLGYEFFKKPQEHILPRELDRKHRLLHIKRIPEWMRKKQLLKFEQDAIKKKHQRRKDMKYKKKIRRTFPLFSKEDIEYGIKQRRKRSQRGYFDADEY